MLQPELFGGIVGMLLMIEKHTHTHTRQELDHLSDPSATESRKTLTKPHYILLYLIIIHNIYIYTVATSCDLNAPTCATDVLRSRGGVFVAH